MARITGISNLPNCRALLLDGETERDQYTKATVAGETFDAIVPLAKVDGARSVMKTSIGIVADQDRYPDSFFIGKLVTVA